MLRCGVDTGSRVFVYVCVFVSVFVCVFVCVFVRILMCAFIILFAFLSEINRNCDLISPLAL